MARLTSPPQPFRIGPHLIEPGARRTVDLAVSEMSGHTPVNLSVHVVHGREAGPVLFVSAAVHGDEVIGVEIVRRVLRAVDLSSMRGALIAIPIVNRFGFLNQSRYLPDRRDLNRSFPGSPEGSLAARLAHLFMREIVERSDLGIDLHSASAHRTNFPQLRIAPSKPETVALAEAFGAPVILTSKLREGSLRQAAQAVGVDMLLFEGGEGLRFDEFAVRTGAAGVLRVMHALGMLPSASVSGPDAAPLKSRSSAWLRAPAGGLLRSFKTVGDRVGAHDVLGVIADAFGETEREILADEAGLIIGRTNLPVVNEGDALFHLARLNPEDKVAATLDSLASQLDAEPLFDEDEII